MKQRIINAENCITGRLASCVAKSLLNGEEIMIVNAEKAVISGKPESILEEFRAKVDRGDPYHGPFYPKKPERIFRRIVRGMLPYHKSKGRQAFRRLKVFVSVPEEFRNEKLETLEKAKNKLEGKFVTLEKLSEKICGS